MNDHKDKVSIIIPCLNEQDYIAKCLDSVIANDYSNDFLEVIVIDGMSTDRTREIIHQYQDKYRFVRLLDNPKRTAPSALNIGIKNATGDIVIRMDAHTTYSRNYVSKCVETLKEFNADNVGGVIRTLPGKNTFIAKLIALSIGHPFGVGMSYFRVAKTRMPPCPVDTVPFGCFRRELFKKIGYFDESLPRVEDIDFNNRIKEVGGKIILNPEIVSFYYARGSLKDFWKHNFDNGYLVTAPLGRSQAHYVGRHLIPLLSLGGFILLIPFSFFSEVARWLLGGLIGFYMSLSLYFSLKTALRQRNPIFLVLMPFIFGFLHLSYGLGSLWGLIRSSWFRIKGPRK